MIALYLAASLAVSPGITQDSPWRWQVNDLNSLMIDDKPYQPIGVRIEGSPDAINKASSAGIKDAIVELPVDGSGWNAAFEALSKTGMRFLVAISSAGPSAKGYAIEPEGYRMGGLTTSQHLNLLLPGATEALLVLALQRDSSVQTSTRVRLKDGVLTHELEVPSELEHVLLIYPLVRELRMPDYWEALDVHRDQLLHSMKAHKAGPNFMGLVNPMGTLVRFPGPDVQFVPASPVFQMELEAYLRQRYTSLDTALRSWAIQAPDLQSFAELSRLVPLWASNRGVPVLWDTQGNRQFKCDSRTSAAWQDIRATILAAANRRYAKLVAAIKKVADVPIIQEWNGWDGPYEGPASGLSGIGMRVIGNNLVSMLESGTRAASAALRWQKPCWLVATDVRFAAADELELNLAELVRESAGFGTRGWFVRPTSDAILQAISKLGASSGLDPLLSEMKSSGVFFPESARNPAFPVNLSGRRWWLPSPASGSRIDLGDLYAAYRYKDGDGNVTALWSLGAPRRTKLRASDPKSLQVLAFDGYDPKPRISKKTLEITIPRTPILIRGTDEIPIPEDALQETVAALEVLFKQHEKRLFSFAEERYYFADRVASVDRNPGAAYLALRAQLSRLTRMLSTTLWIDAESTKKTNFSGVSPAPGTTGGNALMLKTRLSSPPEGYYATYKFTPRVEGMHEVWIAVQITPDQIGNMIVRIGDQALKLPTESVSPYAVGYAWMKLGEVSLIRSPIELKVMVNSATGGELGVDSIVVSPSLFVPNGAKEAVIPWTPNSPK